MARLGDTQDRPLWVKLSEGSITLEGDVQVDFGDLADLDTGAGVDEHPVFAIGMAGPGGHVVWDGSVQTGLEDELANVLAQLEAVADVLVDVWDDVGNRLRVDALGLVGVKGEDGATIASTTNPFPIALWDDSGHRANVEATGELDVAIKDRYGHWLNVAKEGETYTQAQDGLLPIAGVDSVGAGAKFYAIFVDPATHRLLVNTGLDDELQAIQDVLVDAWDDLNNALRTRTTVLNWPATFPTGAEHAEDAAHVSGDLGYMLLTVRQATATALAGTDGDYQPLVTGPDGRLFTRQVIDAPSDGNDFDLAAENQTASAQLLASIPAGKTEAWITTMVLSAYNTDTGNPGRLALRDATAAGSTNIKVPYVMSPAGVAAGLSTVPLQGGSVTFAKPLKMTNGIRLELLGGTIRYSVSVQGFYR